MTSTLSIDVAAPPDAVFRLARDVRRWPRLLPHYVRVRVLEHGADGTVVAEMVALRPLVPLLGLGLPVAWRAQAWNEPATLRLRFVHRGGATSGMDVTWRIEATRGGCRVSIDHDFRPRLPRPLARAWAGMVERVFIRPIAGRTLATFKGIAETITAIEREDQSNAVRTTHLST